MREKLTPHRFTPRDVIAVMMILTCAVLAVLDVSRQTVLSILVIVAIYYFPKRNGKDEK